jgi:hypothetical protein
VGVDIARYDRIAMDDYRPKASAVRVLREDAALLDSWARNGVRCAWSGLVSGERSPAVAGGDSRLRAASATQAGAARRAERYRLDSMSLFDSGKWVLKPVPQSGWSTHWWH